MTARRAARAGVIVLRPIQSARSRVSDEPQPLDGDRCDLFGSEPITVVTSEVNPDRLYLSLYALRAAGYPGLEFDVPDDTDEWLYRAMLGDVESLSCGLQGIAGRLYCGFNIPASYLQTSQDLKLFVNGCTPPIYVVEDVFIFEEAKPPESQCTSGLNQDACTAAGGNWDCSVVGAPCSCKCP